MTVRHQAPLPMEIAPGCYAIDNFLGAWCYLLTGASNLIVDTGVPGRASAILRALARIGVAPTGVDHIVLTHFDLDHSGSAVALAAHTGAPIIIHEADAPYLATPEACPRLRAALYWPLITWLLRWHRPSEVTLVREGEMLGDWQILHTPGHTPGSITLHRDDILVVGDAIVHRGGRLRENAPWLATNLAEQRASARRLATIDARVVLPGHYSPSADPTAIRKLRQWLARQE